MIEVVGGKEGDRHDFFEFLRILYPGYEESTETLRMELSDSAWKISNGTDEFLFPFTGNYDKVSRGKIKKILLEDLEFPGKSETPWGTLIGIRPIKLILDLLKEHTEKETANILKTEYGMKENGIDFLLETGLREQKILAGISPNTYSIYLHIPFCPTRCEYCSYPTIKTEKRESMKRYIKTITEEIDYYSGRFENPPVTIYIGGGTPSAIPAEDLFRICERLTEVFGMPKEFTVECGRPDTITEELLRGLKDRGVNRISINPQTMHEPTLKVLGRKHSIAEVDQALEAANKTGFDVINMDLILGLPGETPEIFLESVRRVLTREPENITIHSLSLKNGAKFWEKQKASPFKYEDVEYSASKAREMLRREGYTPYYMYRQKRTVGNGMNAGYALPGKASLYNVLMMEERQSILGLGMSCTSKFYYPEEDRIEKVYQYKNLRDYTEKWRERQEKKEKFLTEFNF